MFDRTLWSCLTEHFDRSDRSGICPQDLRDCPRSNCSPSLKPSDVAPPSSWGSSPLRRRDGVALSELRLNPTPGPVTPWLSWKWSTGRPQTAQLLRGKQTAPTPKKQIYIYIYIIFNQPIGLQHAPQWQQILMSVSNIWYHLVVESRNSTLPWESRFKFALCCLNTLEPTSKASRFKNSRCKSSWI